MGLGRNLPHEIPDRFELLKLRRPVAYTIMKFGVEDERFEPGPLELVNPPLGVEVALGPSPDISRKN